MEHWKGGQFYLGNYIICFVIIAIFFYLVQYTIQSKSNCYSPICQAKSKHSTPSPEAVQISVSPGTEQSKFNSHLPTLEDDC